MPFEDIEIRIDRNGKIYLCVDGVSEERIRKFKEFLEEQVGAIHSMEIIRRADWDRPSGQLSDEAVKKPSELKLDRND